MSAALEEPEVTEAAFVPLRLGRPGAMAVVVGVTIILFLVVKATLAAIEFGTGDPPAQQQFQDLSNRAKQLGDSQRAPVQQPR